MPGYDYALSEADIKKIIFEKFHGPYYSFLSQSLFEERVKLMYYFYLQIIDSHPKESGHSLGFSNRDLAFRDILFLFLDGIMKKKIEGQEPNE